jgi:hypothetical protein
MPKDSWMPRGALLPSRGEKIRLLLIVAFDRYAVARLDDCFEQQRRAVGGADFSARAAERGIPSGWREARSAPRRDVSDIMNLFRCP